MLGSQGDDRRAGAHEKGPAGDKQSIRAHGCDGGERGGIVAVVYRYYGHFNVSETGLQNAARELPPRSSDLSGIHHAAIPPANEIDKA